MSDDLGMKALTGTIAERAQAVLAAGSDVALLCSGDLAETESVAGVVAAACRGRRWRASSAPVPYSGNKQPFDVAEAEACLAEVLRGVA